jgi:predicted SprT family Zn-dependent metalloprotease
MHTTQDPTKRTYATLQAAMRHFNKALFDDALPHCLVTFQRRARTFGYYSHDKFENREDGSLTPELSLNPKHFNERTPEATLSTLVHEMVHHWQWNFGKPGRGGYHNRQWADRMSELGLEPSSTGKPGGRRTGQTVSHWMLWGDRITERKGGGGKRSKCVCPDQDCGLAAWARPGVQLLCGEHDQATPMVEQSPPPV